MEENDKRVPRREKDDAHTMMHCSETKSWEEAREPKVISLPTSLNVLSLGSTLRGRESGKDLEMSREDDL